MSEKAVYPGHSDPKIDKETDGKMTRETVEENAHGARGTDLHEKLNTGKCTVYLRTFSSRNVMYSGKTLLSL